MGSLAILGQIWARNRTFLFGDQICNSVDNHFYCLILSLFRECNIAQLTGCPHPAECGVTMGLAVLKTYGIIKFGIRFCPRCFSCQKFLFSESNGRRISLSFVPSNRGQRGNWDFCRLEQNDRGESHFLRGWRY